MEEKSSPAKTKFKWPRYPSTAAGIQVNHCKSPTCRNFGVPPKLESRRGGASTGRTHGPGDYSVVATGKAQPALKCLLCGEIFPMHSNLAIAEELLRISDYLEPMVPRCPNLDCAGLEPHCTKYGVTASTTARWARTRRRPLCAWAWPVAPLRPKTSCTLSQRPRLANGVVRLAKTLLRPLRRP